MQNPALFVRVSTPEGHYTVPAAVAERSDSSWKVLKQDALDKGGRPLAPKPRVDVESTPPSAKKRAAKRRATTELRDESAAATPTPDPEADASGETD